MTDYDLPDLPSDKDLGITPEDVEAFESGASPEKGGSPPPAEPPKGKPPKPPKPPKAPFPTAPRGGARGWLTLVALLIFAWLSSTGRAVPSPQPANAPDTAFSSARAMTELVEIARLPHPPGSPEHQRVRSYLMRRLTDLGLQPHDISTTVMLRSGSSIRAARVHDIAARIPGTASTGTILIAAHYDSRPLSPGGADDGAGVVSILEAVRALRATHPLKNDVVVLFTDAEEEGLLGARAFVADSAWMKGIRVALNFDMRGAAGPAVMFQTGPRSGWVMHELAQGDPRPFANSISQTIYQRMPNGTDFSIFEKAGIQGLNFAAIGRPDVYHQSDDDPEDLSEGTLQDIGIQALSTLRTLGEANLSTVDAPDVVYFRVPYVGLVEYARRWVIPISVGVLLLFAALVTWARRKGARWSGMATGLALAAISTGAAYGLGSILFSWLRHFHPEYGALAGSAFHSEGWYVLALAGASFFLVTALAGLTRLRCSTAELSLGALVLPLVGMAWLTFEVPAGAMNLQGPVLAAVVATAVAVGYAERDRPGLLGWILVLLFAAPVLMFLVPMVELVWLAGSFRIAGLLGVMVTLVLLLLVPVLGLLEEPNRWWAPIGGLAVGAACLGVGILLARPGPTRPAPSTLLYALDHGSGKAFWATRPDSDSAAAQTPAEAWARERAGSPFDSVRSLEPFMFRNVRYAVAPARAVVAPEPDISLVGDSLGGGRRWVRVAIHSAIGAERLLVRLPGDSAARLDAVDGRAVPTSGGARFAPFDGAVLDYWGAAQDTVTLDFDVDSTTNALDLVVVEHLLRPSELLGAGAFRRPPSLEPDVATASDQAMLRTPVHLALMTQTPPSSTAGSGAGVGGGLPPPGVLPR